MGEFRRIKMSLFLLLLPQFTATSQQLFLSSVVRVGHDATLSCENVIDDQNNCDGTTWIFAVSRGKETVELINLGQIGREARSKSDRLSVTENCSLVIKNVTVEDVGRYTCRQFDKSGQQQGQDGWVLLSVVTMTEQKDADDDDDDDEVTLRCSVLTYERCRLTVKWLFNSKELEKNRESSQSPCSSSVTLETRHFMYESRYTFLKCEVTDGNKVQQFPFSLKPSGEKPGEETTRVTTKQTTTATTTTTESATTKLTGTTKDASTELKDLWWVFIVVAAVVLIALLIIVVKVIRWKRAKGNKTRMNDKIGLTSDPAGTQSAPETGQDTADPEDGISYASISYIKKIDSDVRVHSKNDDEGDAVTYTAVKVSSTDPSNLYATIHEPR